MYWGIELIIVSKLILGFYEFKGNEDDDENDGVYGERWWGW